MTKEVYIKRAEIPKASSIIAEAFINLNFSEKELHDFLKGVLVPQNAINLVAALGYAEGIMYGGNSKKIQPNKEQKSTKSRKSGGEDKQMAVIK